MENRDVAQTPGPWRFHGQRAISYSILAAAGFVAFESDLSPLLAAAALYAALVFGLAALMHAEEWSNTRA
ncbi:MAG: hypothetical protein ABI282_11105 [Candidatus Baltobacteraceae bacterium]